MVTVKETMKQLNQPGVKKELQDSFGYLAADKKKSGVELLLALFEMHPETKSYFKHFGDLSPDKAWSNRKLRGHGATLIDGFQAFIDQLDDLECFEDVGRKFAVFHLGIGMTSAQMQLIDDPLQSLLGDKMGSKFTDRTKDCWTKFVAFMLAILDDEKRLHRK